VVINLNRDSNLNNKDLDFEKMNATLADPNFANWYYHQIIDNANENMEFSIEDFVKTINNYKLN